MFDVYCPRHRGRVLLGHRSIDRLDNTPEGVVLHWTCRCGQHGTLTTGRRAVANTRAARPAA